MNAQLEPLGVGPLEPELPPGYTPEDDKDSALRDEWREEQREFDESMREKCSDLR